MTETSSVLGWSEWSSNQTALADPLHVLEPLMCPVLMLHGGYDPHPGRMIRDSLTPHLPQLEYHEFDRCGHSPWMEEHARSDFLELLRNWAWPASS